MDGLLIKMILFLLCLSTCSLIQGSPLPDDETGWWDTVTSNLSLWHAEVGEGSSETSEDNDEEIKNSVKLAELFPTLKEQLESPDEKEREEAKEFIKRMNTQIQEKKRYTNMLWKGVKTIIDMGRLESNERRSNEKEVNIFTRMIKRIINVFKWMLGMEIEDDNDDDEKSKKSESTKNEKGSHEHSDEHSSTHHSTASDRKAGLKDDLDHYKENTEEFIEGDVPRNAESRAGAQHKPQHFDPKTGTKGKLDVIEPNEPAVEFLHDKENQPDGAGSAKTD